MTKIEIHHYTKRLEQSERRIKNLDTPEINKELIFKFEQYLVRENLSKGRIDRYLQILAIITKSFNKEFMKITKEDVEEFVTDIQRRDYSEWTKQMYKVMLKRFFQWLKGCERKEYPLEVKWIKTNFPKNMQKLPSEGDLLIEDEVKKLLEVSDHARNKALVIVLWESGARVGEILGLRIKDVVFDKYGSIINVTGKTGPRKIRLVGSTPYIANWLQQHMGRNDRESPLWVNISNKYIGEFLEYDSFRRILRQAFEKAKINKRCNPHSFRHARATYLANHLTEFQMNQYFGWVQGSDMPSTYVHLSGKNTDGALLKLYGLSVDEKKEESQLKPKVCSRCEFLNASENKFCSKCGGVLDSVVAIQFDEQNKQLKEKREMADSYLNKLIDDPEVLQLLVSKLRTLKIDC
ncbi:tyrosine-type recombinase/integrase [Candidatus Woesearchaeota archaeon]|nr:tyrosine-type recombinase/integrase [Candidatus Woesearchaeota archaeon]